MAERMRRGRTINLRDGGGERRLGGNLFFKYLINLVWEVNGDWGGMSAQLVVCLEQAEREYQW